MELALSLITRKLETMVEAADPNQILLKRKAISALLPYVIHLDHGEQQRMVDAISCAIDTSDSGAFVWHFVKPHITMLFNKPSPPYQSQVVTLASPYLGWDDSVHDETTVTRWAAAALAVPYTERVGQSVVDALLQIAFIDSLRPYIPIDLWAWLKRQPSLPPECRGREVGTEPDVVNYVRGLGDIEILQSYLLMWSEWDFLYDSGFMEMQTIVREDFSGIGMWSNRADLIDRLGFVLTQFDRGLGYLKQYRPRIGEHDIQWAKEQYREMEEVLLEVDREAANILTRTSSTLILFN